MKKEDGGSAFPTDHFIVEEHPEKDRTRRVFVPGSGMALRDYFAAAALGMEGIVVNDAEGIAIRAYLIADAMLAARVAR